MGKEPERMVASVIENTLLGGVHDNNICSGSRISYLRVIVREQ